MDAVQAVVTETAELVKNTSRGDRVVTNFECEDGKEAKIWCDPDGGEANFAYSLNKGDQVILVRDSGKNGIYHTYRDQDIEQAPSQPQRQPQQQQSQPQTQGGSASRAEVAREILNDLEANASFMRRIHQELRQEFENADGLNVPSEEVLGRMANSIYIQIHDDY